MVWLPCLLVGCASETFIGREDLKQVQGSELPAPTAADVSAGEQPYAINAADRVSVNVFGVPELEQTVTVDAAGNIALPLAGSIHVAGRTPAELSTLIADRLRGRYVRNPQVTVNVDAVNQLVTVSGQVQQPGMYPIVGPMTLMRAVARARGLTDYGNTKFVVVYRRVQQQEFAAVYDLRAIRQGLYADPRIYANDVIYVGESGPRRALQTIIAGSGLISTPIIFAIQNL